MVLFAQPRNSKLVRLQGVTIILPGPSQDLVLVEQEEIVASADRPFMAKDKTCYSETQVPDTDLQCFCRRWKIILCWTICVDSC